MKLQREILIQSILVGLEASNVRTIPIFVESMINSKPGSKSTLFWSELHSHELDTWKEETSSKTYKEELNIQKLKSRL